MSDPQQVRNHTGLFVFHRDLRLSDNTGLQELLEVCDKVYVAFIFTPEQVVHNPYKSKNAIQFMLECLADLQTQVREHGGELIMLYGNHTSMCSYLIDTYHITMVANNADYSPYARKRDAELEELCMRKNVYYLEYTDYTLHPIGTLVSKSSGEVFKMFTPFYDNVVHLPISKPRPFRNTNKIVSVRPSKHSISLREATARFLGTPNPHLHVHGGRKLGLAQLKKAMRTQSKYTQKRDIFIYETTFLSAYIKFGCVSIREVHTNLTRVYGQSSGIIRELLWREFFAHLLYAFPTTLTTSYRTLPDGVEWKSRPAALKNWMHGTTGLPMIDACMRQLNTTGYMHNRGRMLVATYLTKTLGIHWKHGAQYFAQQLVDYDPASNSGNWQYLSSTGVYANPWFRTMSAEIQQKKYDTEHEYINKWCDDCYKNVDENA
jgi:deoxyribodipyrimidine photo-lyase